MKENTDFQYIKPEEASDAGYLAAIKLAVEGGANVIVTPGFLFEVPIYEAQDLYPDVKFILSCCDSASSGCTWRYVQ